MTKKGFSVGKSYKPVTTKTSNGISGKEVSNQSSSSAPNTSKISISKESFATKPVKDRSNDLKEKSGKNGEKK